jgi:heme exporter protein B
MNGAGFFRASGQIAVKDLRLEWRTFETLASSLIFSLIVLVVFNFAFDLATVRQVGVARLVPGVLWVVLAFASVVGLARSFLLEQRRDSLAALFLAPIDRGALFLGKFLANWVKLTVLELIVLPLTALLFDYDLLAVLAPLALVVLLHTIGLTELGTLFAAITVRVGRGEALLATLLFPAATPLFISAVKCTAGLLGGNGLDAVSNWLLLTTGFDGLYLVLALLTFDFVLED